jgi:hypothetical protein
MEQNEHNIELVDGKFISTSVIRGDIDKFSEVVEGKKITKTSRSIKLKGDNYNFKSITTKLIPREEITDNRKITCEFVETEKGYTQTLTIRQELNPQEFMGEASRLRGARDQFLPTLNEYNKLDATYKKYEKLVPEARKLIDEITKAQAIKDNIQ